jgi:hypothetical protein
MTECPRCRAGTVWLSATLERSRLVDRLLTEHLCHILVERARSRQPKGKRPTNCVLSEA